MHLGDCCPYIPFPKLLDCSQRLHVAFFDFWETGEERKASSGQGPDEARSLQVNLESNFHLWSVQCVLVIVIVVLI